MNPSFLAQANLQALSKNSYPGRGLVCGITENDKHAVQVVWIMGRGKDSRNRFYNHDGRGRVYTEAADPSQMKDPSLIIYNAMNERNGSLFVASNGEQTDLVIEEHDDDNLDSLPNLLAGDYSYEPDKPNYTPRITAVLRLHGPTSNDAMLEILAIKKSVLGESAELHNFEYSPLYPGFGHCITTYNGDGNPLPSFTGEPYPLPFSGDGNEIAQYLWAALNPENRVGIAVKTIELATGQSELHIINQYAKK